MTKLKDRIERLEAEITCLKDDMTTKIQIKKIQQDLTTSLSVTDKTFKDELESFKKQIGLLIQTSKKTLDNDIKTLNAKIVLD
jgi:uncharacterized protein (UPF0335 family)